MAKAPVFLFPENLYPGILRRQILQQFPEPGLPAIQIYQNFQIPEGLTQKGSHRLLQIFFSLPMHTHDHADLAHDFSPLSADVTGGSVLR